jgi:integrase
VEDWVSFLKEERLWGNDDPLFHATRIEQNADRRFRVSGLAREHWSNASPIRTIFREAFNKAGLPYFNPHSFRNTLARLGQELCRSPEDYKAWSQNLGHEKVLTTFTNYGAVERARQGEILRSLAAPEQATPTDANEIAEAVYQRFRGSGVTVQLNKPDG